MVPSILGLVLIMEPYGRGKHMWHQVEKIQNAIHRKKGSDISIELLIKPHDISDLANDMLDLKNALSRFMDTTGSPTALFRRSISVFGM